MSQKTIAIVSLGGTIAMTEGAAGLALTRSSTDLLSRAGAAPAGVALHTHDLLHKPSASLTLDDVLLLVGAIDKLAAEGATGVVVTQGTDTLEEVSFATELLSDALIPVVFTGAMRGASALGHDGGANLADAILVAAHAEGRNEVFVVMNGEAHAARFVTKLHTASLAAFESPDVGPLMRIHESRVIEHARLKTPRAPRIVIDEPPQWPRVALMPLGLGEDGALLSALATTGYEGCILAAPGGGHVPDFSVETIEALARTMPVVLCSRAAGGRTFEQTYGYPGSERDLLGRGVLSGAGLNAAKARLLLTLSIAADRSTAAARFELIRKEVFG